MDDILLTESNSKAFKESIYKSLNTDTKEIFNKINEDLIKTYIDNISKKELANQKENEILLNPMIVKLSKVEKIYNMFAKDITNLSYEDYLNKVKKVICSKKELSLIKKYATNNLDVLDFKNPIELEISSIYANLILKDNLKKEDNQKWFITYIIRKEATNHKLKPNIIFITIKHIKKSTLVSKNKYLYYKELELIDPYSNNIYINIGLFNIIKKYKSDEEALVYLLNKCFKALQKHIQNNNRHSITYDDTMYRFIKEGIIFKEDNKFYNQNKTYFSTEININEETNNMTKSLVSNPLFTNFDFLKEFSEKENFSSYKNAKDYLEVDSHIDNILLDKPSILKNYPLLQMEYNENGTRKNIKELVDIKNKQINFFNEQISNYKIIIDETDNDIIKGNMQNKLDDIENGLGGVIRCHNNMIYKALRVLTIPDFNKLLTNLDDNYIKDLEDVIRQEKEDIIKKLANNRSKIFKPTTFLKNDEFLTTEYSKVARYESKINDFKHDNK